MSIHYSPSIVRDGLVFAWDGANPKCWDGATLSHRDLITGAIGSAIITGDFTIARNGTHTEFSGTTGAARIAFPVPDIDLPNGDEATWIWGGQFVDSGSHDHVAISSCTDNGWTGIGGFVFGTGWGTDGPRWGIGGQSYSIYTTMDDPTGQYRYNFWHVYVVTYKRNSADGLKTYLLDSTGMRLVDTRATMDNAIGTNTGDFTIGSGENGGDRWTGSIDCVYVYNKELTSAEVFRNFHIINCRMGVI